MEYYHFQRCELKKKIMFDLFVKKIFLANGAIETIVLGHSAAYFGVKQKLRRRSYGYQLYWLTHIVCDAIMFGWQFRNYRKNDWASFLVLVFYKIWPFLDPSTQRSAGDRTAPGRSEFWILMIYLNVKRRALESETNATWETIVIKLVLLSKLATKIGGTTAWLSYGLALLSTNSKGSNFVRCICWNVPSWRSNIRIVMATASTQRPKLIL